MRKIKLPIILFVTIFLMSACLAGPRNTGPKTEGSDQTKWQTYINDIYHFSVQFPLAWQVMALPTPEYPTTTDQVWFISETLPQPQTDSRADIVFIFTQQDPSPNWDPQYFVDYQEDTFQMGDIQARRISGINKESGSSEIVVLVKMGDYYLQALPNHGEASLTYFDPVVSSIRLTQTDSPIPTTSSPEMSEDKPIATKGISFTIPASLAEGTTAYNIHAFVDPSGFMYNDIPEHVRFDFSNPYTQRAPFSKFQPGWVPWLSHQNPENPEIVPQIFIFPTTEYATISPLAGERIETLKLLLADSALLAAGELPVLPTFNSTQDLRTQVYPLTFPGGRGLRFIAHYAQGVNPLLNPMVFYTFQGLTEDGSLYIAAFFPLYIPILPDQIQVEDWDAFNQGYQDYMADIISRLEGLDSDDFEPPLETLDALIRSITILGKTASTPMDMSSTKVMPTTEP